jgi:hypothetical protein
VTAELEELKEVGWPKIAAYVFTRKGRFLAKGLLEPDPRKPTLGQTTVKVETEPEQLVVKIGPDVEDVTELARYQLPVQPALLTAEPAITVALKVGKPIWACWIKVPYLVTGKVEKVTSAGHLPICYGEVDVYDVDVGFCFLRLPDRIIELIRDGLIDVLVDPPRIKQPEELPHWDDDWVETAPRPTFAPPPPDQEIEKRLEVLPPEWAFARDRFKALASARPRMDATLERLDVAEKQALLDREAVQGIRIREILYTNTAQFRELLVNRFLSFRYWLCWWPWIYWLWWPWCRWYSLEKLGTATLQPDGSFSLKVWLSICRHDTPDLWFVVRQKIGAVERVIYRALPVPCHTYWNHKSGDPVTLHVTDPSAYACQEQPPVDQPDQDRWIVPLAIGNYSLKQIYGTGAAKDPLGSPPTPPGNNADPYVGRYESISIGAGGPNLNTFYKGPFGGTLGLRFLFSPALLAAGIKWYRIKYRLNGAGAWRPLTATVVRHYSNWNTVTSSIEFPAYQLGPIPGGDWLYELQPDNPPNIGTYAWARWEVIDATVDLMNGYVDTTQLMVDESTTVNYGTVEFKFELFDSQAPLHRVDPVAAGISWRLPNNIDHWNTVTTVDPALVNTDLVVVDPEDPAFHAFIFRLVVDNRATKAVISEPVLSAGVVGSCGMLHPAPGASLTMGYEASQPARNAMYRFSLYRGATLLLDGSSPTSGTREGQAELTGTILQVGGSLVLVTDLLGPCPEGAFSENLYVYHMNFNGWWRVGPDASAVRAFALTAPGP